MQLDTSHKDFHNLRGCEKLEDGRGTLSFARHGKNGELLERRAEQFEKAKAMLPYRYVYLKRVNNFDQLAKVK